ncbi:MAG: twin-arginine translocation pathway signal protein [Proteobacteria bacterium]|nr:twin-arginine translocation pathway signal protein [Pseudomonadota bacterium]
MTTRRHVLHVLAAAPALTACGGEQLPDPAAAWRNPGAGERDPRRFALAHAILAPNPHNTQPWLVTLHGEDGMALYCDLGRRLPFTDPFDRQITIGCGAFLECYRLALRHLGYAPVITAFPDGEPSPRLDAKPLAHVNFGARTDAPADPLFDYIAARRTNRSPYDLTRIPHLTDLQKLADAAYERTGEVEWALEPERVAHLRDIVWRAFELEMHTPGALAETFGWLRFGRDEVARHRDGLAVEGPLIGAAKLFGMFGRANMLNPNSEANRQALQDWRRKIDTAPAFAWLSMQENDDTPTGRLTAGMAYARMNLAATGAGLAIHPWSQGLQEYREMASIRSELRTALQNGENFPHMLVRIGYADPVEPAARRGVDAIMRPAAGAP